MSREIYLISKDLDLVHHFEDQREANASEIKPIESGLAMSGKALSSCPVLVIDSAGGWEKSLKTLETKRKKDGQEFYVIISGSPSLKKTVSQIREIAVRLNGYVETEEEPKNDKKKGEEEYALHLSQLLESKLSDFVRKVKHSRPKNLYDFLISEFEKPLFTLALQETGDNQVQAAKLLGVNRNTLKKKIKEFKIKIEKRPKRGVRSLPIRNARPPERDA